MKSNVYTVLVIVAFIILAVGVGTLYKVQQDYFGTGNPFVVPEGRPGR